MTKKVLILGDAGVGKTSLRSQYFHKTFSYSYRATIGANFLTKNVTLPLLRSNETYASMSSSISSGTARGEQVEATLSLCIWDTAGQERFNSLSPTFFRGTDCAILLYDVTCPQSLANLQRHHREFLEYCGTRNPIILVVGNKADEPDRQVTIQDAQRVIPHVMCLEVSAKLGTSVDHLFVEVARMLQARDEERREMLAFDVDEDDTGGPTGSRFGTVDLGRKRSSLHGCAC